jgi:hypothetical protein
MARGTTLESLVQMVREEAGHSTNVALGTNTIEALKTKIRRTQEVLWQEHEWPHMRVAREVALQAGSRYYDFPSDLSLTHRVDEVAIYYDERWHVVEPGIHVGHYNSVNPDEDERRDPVERWDFYELTQLEVWPLPETNDLRLRLKGTRNLAPLLANGDEADLDDRLITLFTAAELVAKQNQNDAEALIAQGRQILQRLKGNNSINRTFYMGDPTHRSTGTRMQTGPRPLYGRKLT